MCENRVSGYIGIVTLLEFVVSFFLSHFFTEGAQDITMILRAMHLQIEQFKSQVGICMKH